MVGSSGAKTCPTSTSRAPDVDTVVGATSPLPTERSSSISAVAWKSRRRVATSGRGMGAVTSGSQGLVPALHAAGRSAWVGPGGLGADLPGLRADLRAAGRDDPLGDC